MFCVELANNIIIRCNHCNYLIFEHGGGYVVNTSYEDHGENGMGNEIIYNISEQIICPNCHTKICFDCYATEYPVGSFNHSFNNISGGKFIEPPQWEMECEDEYSKIISTYGKIENNTFYDIADEMQKLILKIDNNASIVDNIDDRTFERLVEKLYRNLSFKTELTKQTRDGGKDIVARLYKTPVPIVVYIECKAYSIGHKVPVSTIRELLGTMEDANANKCVLMTTSYFTEAALDFAKRHRPRIELLDRDSLINLIHKDVRGFYIKNKNRI